MALYRTGLYVKNHSVEKVQVAKTPIASFNGNVTGLYIPELIAYIEAKQSGSGDPAPDNIRPIIGASECNVVRTGTNVWDEEWENGTFNTTTGANINNTIVNVQIRSKNFIPILPNVQYCFIVPNGEGWFIFFDIDGNVINNPNVTRSSGTSVSGNSVAINNGVIFTVNEPNVRYTRFYMTYSYPSTYNHDIAINYPSTDTNYHAYNGNTYTIQLGDTYYCCYINATTGLMTITDARDKLKNLSWIYQSANTRFFSNSLAGNIIAPATNYDNPEMLCECYTPHSLTGASSGNIYLGTSGNLFVKDSNYTDTTTWLDTVGDYYLLYKLNTPITIQLTPTQVEQFLGANNVWADTGDVEVKFYNVIR